MKYKIIIIFMTCGFLCACSDKNIEIVKNTPINRSEYTYGQLLDGNKDCDSIEWIPLKDEGKKNVVRYSCTTKIDKNVLEKIAAEKRISADKARRYLTDQYQQSLSRATSELEWEKAPDGSFKEGREAKVEKIQSRLNQINNIKDEYFLAVENLHANNYNIIDTFVSSSLEIEILADFLVTDENVKIVKYATLVNKKPYEFGYNGMLTMAVGLEQPSGSVAQTLPPELLASGHE